MSAAPVPSDAPISALTKTVLERLTGALPASAALHEPEFLGNELSYLKECLDTGWVSTAGPFVPRFEAMLAERTGMAEAISITNGTAALHLSLLLAGVQRDEEVLMPSLTFIATANAAAYIGAVPHFVECTEDCLGIDVPKLAAHLAQIAVKRDGQWFNQQTGRRIAAVVCMHTFGHPVDLDPLADLCRDMGLPLVEDAAEALGSQYKGRHVGHHGFIAAFSFNGNKVVTTGGGGAIVTNDRDLARRARHLATTARTPHPWAFNHDEVGYNYRMPNLNAALGCAQLERLEGLIADKRRLAQRYTMLLGGIPGLSVVQEPGYSSSNYWLNAILLSPENAHLRDEILKTLIANGLTARPIWTPMHVLPMYATNPRMDLSVTDSLFARVINLPSSPHLGRNH